MNKAVLIARILLGLMFLVFGINNMVPFLPMPPLTGDAAQFMLIFSQHKWMTVVGLLQVISGVLLLVGRFVPLALAMLAPVVVNILLFHMLLLAGHGIALGALAAVLELFLLWAFRANFVPLFEAAPSARHSL